MQDKKKLNSAPSYLNFDEAKYVWKADINYQTHPHEYRVGKGEQGVLICEPYKSVIGPHWRFKTVEIAEKSAKEIFKLFNNFLKSGDFVGADLARKYLQMGYTRARRYANYKGGKKYDKENDYQPLERGTGDSEKAPAASVFYTYWKKAEQNPDYHSRKTEWKAKYG
ncbi:DUF4385 domain-containing protein [Pedobacter yonginense]|uniref:DUF4385 domain-containing protein n=1 Tax=Pedobacter yonginense TaxID=651869 RepID=A0A317ERY7_9SPHI|nr:DUF4385 domain-containing protein [Pedobacter yonginense]PWS28613.1 DUF4385 domain-containing protein [Pedobacter yonginense]